MALGLSRQGNPCNSWLETRLSWFRRRCEKAKWQNWFGYVGTENWRHPIQRQAHWDLSPNDRLTFRLESWCS